MNPPNTPNDNRIRIGIRSIKTAITTTLCAMLYLILDQNPTFACIGAIFGTGSNMDSAKLNGGNRFFGTIIGGIIGMLLFRVYIIFVPDGKYTPLLLLMLFIGIVLLIVFSQLFRWIGGIQPGGVVLCIILFNTPVETYILYSLERMFDTGVGVAMAILVEWLLPKERLISWYHRLKKTQED